MKAEDIRNMTVEEIEDQVATFKQQLFQIRSESISGRVERPSRIRMLKRDIARCHTILKEKNIDE